jgi:hypothetical protein
MCLNINTEDVNEKFDKFITRTPPIRPLAGQIILYKPENVLETI